MTGTTVAKYVRAGFIAFEQTAAALSASSVMVEKDFWVCWLLGIRSGRRPQLLARAVLHCADAVMVREGLGTTPNRRATSA